MPLDPAWHQHNKRCKCLPSLFPRAHFTCLRAMILLQSYVADDGCLHIVAERASIQAAVAGLDLERARLLTRLSLFWVRRVRWVADTPESPMP